MKLAVAFLDDNGSCTHVHRSSRIPLSSPCWRAVAWVRPLPRQAPEALAGWLLRDEAVVGMRRVYPGQAPGLPAIAGPRDRRGSGVKGGPRAVA